MKDKQWHKENDIKRKEQRKKDRDLKRGRTARGLLIKVFKIKKAGYEAKWNKAFPLKRNIFISHFIKHPGFLMKFNYWVSSNYNEQYRPYLQLIHRAWKLDNIVWVSGRFWEKNNQQQPIDLGEPKPATTLDDRTKFVIERLLEKNWAGPRSTKEEFYAFLSGNILWNDLYNKWKESGFRPGLKPWALKNKTKNGLVFTNLLMMPEWEAKSIMASRSLYAAKHNTAIIPQVGLNEFASNIMKQLGKGASL